MGLMWMCRQIKTFEAVARGMLRRDRVVCQPPHFLIFGILLAPLLFLGACAAPGISTPGTMSTLTSPTATVVITTATVIHADIVLTESQHQQLTTAKVGQIINVLDLPEFEWSVSYYDQVLLALTPPEKIKQPGASGWFFRVIAPGNTEIVLESIAPPCPASTLCPPNIIRWVFPIQAEP